MPILPGLIANSGGSQPTPPTGLFSSATTVSSFTLNWTPPDFLGKLTPIRYVVSLYDSSGSLLNSSHKTVNYPATSVVVDGLAEGTTYSVRMRLENSSGIFSALSAPSANITTAVTPPPPPPPPPPSSTTWFCTINSVGAGVSSYPSNQDETGAICNSYAISCSTSGYPGAPSIPTCTTNPPPGPEPVPSCAEACGPYGSYGSCINGTQYSTRTCSGNPSCQETRSRTCCTPKCGDFGPWTRITSDGEIRSRTCLRSDCTTYTESETRCVSRVTTSCGTCRRVRGRGTQTCTTVSTYRDCSQSTTSFARSC